MNPAEMISIMFMSFMLFGTPVAIFAIKVFGNRQRVSSAETEQLRALCHSQTELIHQLQARVENLEHVVSASEYQAAQRVSRAIDENRAVAEVRIPNRGSQSVERSVVN